MVTAPGMIDREELGECLQGPLQFADCRSEELFRSATLAFRGESTANTGFPSLAQRLGSHMKKTTIEQYLRELGTQISEPIQLIIGGSSALILLELLGRATEDIDVVDEVPKSLRELHSWRSDAQRRYGLYLAHFQSHYLPQGWQARCRSLGSFGKLVVSTVNPVDIFVGKLFSKRSKDLDDLRALAPRLERAEIDQMILEARGLRDDQERLDVAQRNYYIVFGEEFPESKG